jgi:plasmid stabilization system protein ParE
MAHVAWTRPALNELFEIATAIAENAESRAEKFVAGAFDKTDLLGQHPFLGQVFRHDVPGKLRQLVYGDYLLIYHILGDVVEILAITHGSRNLWLLSKEIQSRNET